ncbi:MAG: efflux RND transporter permease subunit [Planctomycetota bacterium]
MNEQQHDEQAQPRGFLAGLVRTFLAGRLSIILVVAALVLGVAAILVTPREEDPQIVVPIADVYVQYPGGSADEVEKLVAAPLEKYLWQIDGVEYVYSISRRGMAVVTVRFYVGEDREESLIKLHNRILMHQDRAPPGVSGWIVKPVAIDDVPVVTITLHPDDPTSDIDDHVLRRVGEEVLARLEQVPDVSRTRIAGGRQRVVRVTPDPQALQARGLSLHQVTQAIAAADVQLVTTGFARGDQQQPVIAGPFIDAVGDVEDLVVGADGGRPVYLRDVASIRDGPEEAPHYSRMGKPAWDDTRPAVTLALAKKQGTNAVTVTDAVVAEMQRLQEEVLPAGVAWTVTRDRGATANAKVDELLGSLGFAMVAVVGLLLVTLGWREGLVVALAVPISFSLALFVNYVSGYTINRVTLFALILTLGLVVDDPITNVDNIQRHILMRRRGPFAATLVAVQEVMPPVIMSTLAIIVSFLPLFFITGMMGPYMQPMAVNVPLTVTFSTLTALTVVPWAAHRLLGPRAERRKSENDEQQDDGTGGMRGRILDTLLGPLLASRGKRWLLLAAIGALLAGCGALVLLRLVPLKMLPFDNKNELQLVIDMPEGSSLERTDAVVRDFERYLFTVPEMQDFQSYVGTYSPIDFNGLVRHAYFREQPHVADIRFNLLDKDARQQQSHDIGLRLRDDLEAIAATHGASLAITEVPPGPPVVATITAEVYGPPAASYQQLIDGARRVADMMRAEPGVRDVDVSAQDPHQRWAFRLDKEKAALHGIDTQLVVGIIRTALDGAEPATVHTAGERSPLHIRVRLTRRDRAGIEELRELMVPAASGDLVPLAELGHFEQEQVEQPIYHKNLQRVVYAFGESVGRAPAESILSMGGQLSREPLPHQLRVDWAGEGEWQITLRVFRDLGIAFGAAMIGIYILLVVQTGSFGMPLVVMSSIPLTAIGILPGFWLLNMIADNPVGGYATPVFFTATAMIGMIALGGIVVRNSLVLIEFMRDGIAAGQPVQRAILDSGAIRMRPILLTAVTTALGAWPITFDPIFSGLAWALIFGLFASTAFTLIVVPVLYYMIAGAKIEAERGE